MGYSSEVYELAESELERRRMLSEQELEKRREILFARSPRAEEIERTIAKTSVRAAKAVLNGADVKAELAELKKNNMALKKELDEIIAGFGFQKDYLELRHKCDVCKDRGDIDGKMCSCMKMLLRQISYDRLNSSSPLSLSDFDSFSLDYYSKTPSKNESISPYTQMNGVYGFCRKYAHNFSTESRSLLFQGAPGLGKTHLSLAIASELIEKGFGVIYTSAPELLSRMSRENLDFNFSENISIGQYLSDCDLLILDDLGTEYSTKFTVAALYNIINTRVILSKPTIISTNLSVDELEEKYNQRIVSRIIGTMRRVEFIGTDIRYLKRKNIKRSEGVN